MFAATRREAWRRQRPGGARPEEDIDLTGDPFRRVAERLADQLYRDTHGKQERAGRVAQLVGGPCPEPRTLADPGEVVAEVVGVYRGTDRRGEHDAGVILAASGGPAAPGSLRLG